LKSNNIQRIGQTYKKIAELYEHNYQLDKAQAAYDKSSQFFLTENQLA